MRSILKRSSFGRRGRRVPRRNRTFLRLEELETRTVLSPSAVGLALPMAQGLGSGLSAAVPRVMTFATPPGQGQGFGLANAPGIARFASQPGGTTSSPVPGTSTGTLPGTTLLSNPSDPMNPTQTTIPGPASSSTMSSGTSTSSATFQQNAAAASPFLLSPTQTSPATTTNNNTTGNNTAQQGSAGPQSLLVLVLNEPLLLAGAEQRAETIGLITAIQSNPEGAVISAQTLASARASTTPQLRLLLGEVRLSDTEEDNLDGKDENRRLDKPMIPEQLPPKPPKQENNAPKQAQPDDKEAPPVVPLEEAMLSDEAMDSATSDVYFAIWEAEMAPTDQEAQPPVPTSAEETPNWSVAALGLVLGGVWSMSPPRPRKDRKRHPAWPARPTAQM